jgi:F420-dependent oxidoreductase-like protein
VRFGVQISRQLTDLARLGEWITTVGEPAGLDSVWTSESYGWECFTPLAWIGARTNRVRLATGIAAMPARTPTSAAMSAMTLDHLSGGRVILGLGVSGPRVAEGWYGQPFGKPLRRTREYVDVVRSAIRRDGPLTYHGDYYQIPADGQHERGLKSFLHPLRREIPIYLGVQGTRNTTLAGEIADGMITGWFSPASSEWIQERLQKGFAAGSRRRPEDFEVAAIVDVAIARSLTEGADRLRPHVAFHVAKMGPPGSNFYYDTFVRLGYEETCKRIIAAYGESQESATRIIPDSMAQEGALVGPLEKIIEDLGQWAESRCDLMVLRGETDELVQVLNAVLG